MQKKCLIYSDNQKDIDLARKRLAETSSPLLESEWSLEYIMEDIIANALSGKEPSKIPLTFSEYDLLIVASVHNNGTNSTSLIGRLHPWAKNNFCVTALGDTQRRAINEGFAAGNYMDLRDYVHRLDKAA